MAKIKDLKYPKLKTSVYLCCFGSLPHKTPTDSTITGSENNVRPKGRNSCWFPWQRIRLRAKNPTTKTVPLEGSESGEKEQLKLKSKGRANKVHSSNSQSQSQSQTNHPPGNQTPPVLTAVTPSQASSQSQTCQQICQDDNVGDYDTRRQSSSSPTRVDPAMSDAVSLPSAKRQGRHLVSSMQPQTTSEHPKQLQNAKRYDPVVGTFVVIVILVIMILWGRLCAILCASAWLYYFPRLRMMVENDEQNSNNNNNSNDLDLDSKAYKKKVILDGLLERNHPAVL